MLNAIKNLVDFFLSLFGIKQAKEEPAPQPEPINPPEEPKQPSNGPKSPEVDPLPINQPNIEIEREYRDLNALVDAITLAWGRLPDAMPAAEWETFRQEMLEIFKSEIDDELSDFEEETVIKRITILLKKYPLAHQLIDDVYIEPGQEEEELEKSGTLSGEDVTEESTVEEAVDTEDEKRDLEIPVFFATDRAIDIDRELAQMFLNKRGDGRLRYGVASVSIPENHQKGTLESPKRWLFQKFNPKKHFTVLSLDLLRQDRFQAKASEDLADANREVLIFIHGYNVSFQGGLRRTAQIAVDLEFQGVPIYYSWPSAVKTLKYTADEASIKWSQPHFDEFLKFVITGLGATKIHAIAHSMGNRLLSNALERLQLEGLPEGAARLRQIVFTAPDVDAETFKQLAAAYEGKADQFTLYASSRDFPLELSAFLHGGNRAGEADETDGGPVIVSPIETVDVSAIDTILAGLGHSYFGGNVRVIDDMIEVINNGKNAVERGLKEINVDSTRRYWQVTK